MFTKNAIPFFDYEKTIQCFTNLLGPYKHYYCGEEANSDSMLELFLGLAFHCLCYYNHTLRFASENPAPLPDC